MRVVSRLLLLLGLFVTPALAGEGGQTNTGLASPEQPASPGSAPADSLKPIVLVPDSTGTAYIAPVQEIHGRRIEPQRKLDRGTGMASVLTRDRWAGQGQDAAEVLGHATGIVLSSTGGLGAAASVRLRGSTAAQVPVYLDGVLLNRPDDTGMNVGALNLQALDRIEIYRGAAPLTLGGGSLGGAIHLSSASNRPLVLASMTARSFGGLVFEGAASTLRGAWLANLSGRLLRADNDWEFLDNRGTLYNTTDDRRIRRINNDVRGGGGVLTIQRPTASGRVQLSATLDASEKGLPGYSTLQSTTARGRSLLAQGQARWTGNTARRGRLRELALYSRMDEQGYRDEDGDLRGVGHDRADRVLTVGARLSGSLRAQGETSWRLELDRAGQKTTDRALSDGDFPGRTRWTAAAAVQPGWRIASDRLLISPGIRLERVFDSERGGRSSQTGTSTLQIGARWSVSDRLILKGNLGQYRRVPTLFELFGDRGSVIGNAELKPESGVNRDLGVVWQSGRPKARVALTWFVNDAFDLILPVQNSPVSVKYQNLARADLHGLEFEFEAGAAGPIRTRWSLSRLWTADRSGRSYAEGHPLPGRPGLVFDFETSARVRRWIGGIDVTILDENFAQTGSRAPLPSRMLMGMSIERRIQAHWSVLGRVANLGNEEVFDLYGYPLPGRQFSLSIRKER